jgi:DNA-binding beta-propeller fold protein YncE
MYRTGIELICMLCAVCLGTIAPSGALAGGFALQWETEGFASPESVLRDADRNVLYVSNVNGLPLDKDGNGFISRVSIDGKMLDREWIKGLDAPKGMAIVGDRLYVTDIDRIVEIDLDNARISNQYPIEGAKFLNDTAAGTDGAVYFTDTATNTIHRFLNGHVEKWLESAELGGPNGVLVDGQRLVVGAFGTAEHPGQLLAVDLARKSISSLSGGKAIGNLDGVEPAPGGYYVSDWVAGRVMLVAEGSEPRTVLSLNQGTADIGYASDSATLYIPLMVDGKVAAYRMQD